MTESIFVRVQRIVSNGLDGALSVAERATGVSLMREAIREVERAQASVREQHAGASARRRQAEHQQQAVRKDGAALVEQARFAISKQRDDLAQAALRRQLELEGELERLASIIAEAKADEARLAESLAALKLRRSQMQDDLAAFEKAQRVAATSGDFQVSADARTRRRVERAEDAFERAMQAAGGISSGRADSGTAAKVAELDELRREAMLAEQLAALKAQAAGSPSAARAKPKKRAAR